MCGMCGPKGCEFWPFWPQIGYQFLPFWAFLIGHGCFPSSLELGMFLEEASLLLLSIGQSTKGFYKSVYGVRSYIGYGIVYPSLKA